MTTVLSRRALAALIALAAGFAPSAATAKDKITVVMSSFDLLFWPTLAAKELGYFEAESIDPDIVRTGGGAKSLAAVAGGDAQFNIGRPPRSGRAPRAAT
jgi:NitT/TauT family transport system substrate-binding protein